MLFWTVAHSRFPGSPRGHPETREPQGAAETQLAVSSTLRFQAEMGLGCSSQYQSPFCILASLSWWGAQSSYQPCWGSWARGKEAALGPTTLCP